jgi:hypothetical protein
MIYPKRPRGPESDVGHLNQVGATIGSLLAINRIAWSNRMPIVARSVSFFSRSDAVE